MARSIEDLMRVVSVRSAVYIAEQECPYLEEFDGNDFCSTHLLGYVGNEPAGCIRIRYFADFAKSNASRSVRSFARPGCRSIWSAPPSIFAASKATSGFTDTRRSAWSISGRASVSNCSKAVRSLCFSDLRLRRNADQDRRHPTAITIGVDPYTIIRPEGRWHLPGILENSKDRAVTRPSLEEQPA